MRIAHRFVLTTLLVFVAYLPKPLASLQEAKQEMEYATATPGPGERCIVCGILLTNDDTVLIVKGRRVPLNYTMVDSFMNNQERYFSKMQPKSALFQEELEAPAGVAQGGVTLGWFFFGLYVLVALIFGGLSGYVGISKGLPPITSFFTGFFLSVLGFIYILTRPATAETVIVPAGLVKVPTTRSPLPCAKCGNTNHPSAKRCSACGSELQSRLQSEVERV